METPCWCPSTWAPTWRQETSRNICHWVLLQKREFISQRTQKRNKIHRIDFSDPQGGKGAAYRLAATCKSHVRLFINEGNDVTTAHQLKDALLSHGGIDGVRVVAMETIEDLVEDSRKIPTISKLNNFAFHDDSITAWRAYDVGKGKEIVLEKTSAGNCKWKYMLGFYLSVNMLFIGMFLVSNYKLCFTTGHHLKFLANSVQLIGWYLNAQLLVFKDVDVKSLITFIRFHTLMRLTHTCLCLGPNKESLPQGFTKSRITY